MLISLLVSLSGAIVLLALVMLSLRALFVVATVQQESMTPTLSPGDRVLVLRIWPRRWLRTGDIVVVWPWQQSAGERWPHAAEAAYIKRIVGMPGETVRTSLRDLAADLQAGQAAAHDQEGWRSWDIPAGHCFVRSDHAVGGFDSLSWGPISTRCVLGLVVHKLNTRAASATARHPSRPSGPPVGQAAPAFAAETLERQAVTLESYRGRHVVFVFVSSGFAPCREVLAQVSAYAALAARANVALVLVSFGDAAATRLLMRKAGIQLPVLVAPGRHNPWASDYIIQELPFFCAIDPHGIVRSAGLPFPAMMAWRELIQTWDAAQ